MLNYSTKWLHWL